MNAVAKLNRDTFRRFLGDDPRAIRAFEELFAQAVDGITAIINGGTGLSDTPADGEILIGNNGAYSLSLISGSTNIEVTVGPGTIAINVYALDAGLINSGILNAGRLPAFTGDISTSAGSSATTLASVNADTGTFGAADAVPVFVVNEKGLILGVTNVLIDIVAAQVSDLGTIATQDANDVTITGGDIDGVPLGASVAATVRGTTITATGAFGCNGKTAQTSATVPAAIAGTAGAAYTATEQGLINSLIASNNAMRTALINNGIAV